MGTLEQALTGLVPGIEKELASRLQGFFGSLLRGYLPQRWVFQTEAETATLTVDRQGTAHVTAGPGDAPDVTIEAKRDILVAAITRGKGSNAHARDFRITTHTKKGETAFRFLRDRFGL